MVKLLFALIIGLFFSGHLYADLTANMSRFNGATTIKRLYASKSGSLAIVDYAVKPLSTVSSTTNSVLSVTSNVVAETIDTTAPKLDKKPMNYPNPFKKTQSTTIFYSLSRTMDVTVDIFDMLGNQVSKIERIAGQSGTLSGPNKLTLAELGIDGRDLSAGVYFYVFLSNGVILGKGKMAVVP